VVDRGHAFFDAHQRCLVGGLGLFSLCLIMNRETPNEPPVAEEERELQARRLFLQSIGKWSGAAIAAAVLAGAWLLDPPETKAGAWVNRRGGGGGGWINRRGGGGGGWINRGGGGGWVNRWGGGGGWINRGGGGGGWINRW
jgi:hypothetical protein